MNNTQKTQEVPGIFFSLVCALGLLGLAFVFTRDELTEWGTLVAMASGGLLALGALELRRWLRSGRG